MEGGIVTDIIVPICLGLMMVGLGMTLVPDDFKRVLLFPKAVGTGLFFQMLILPLIGFALASVFPLKPELAVGVMLLAACPGGITSNVITHLAKGDTALAVTLTVISSSLSLISIPLIVSLSLVHFMGEGSNVRLPIIETVTKVFILTVPTVIAGMTIRAKAPGFAEKSGKAVNIGGLLFLIILVMGVALKEKDMIIAQTLHIGPVAISLCVITMVISFTGSRLIKVSKPQSISVAVGTGLQNSGLALVIATSFLKNAQIAIAPAFYTLAMYLSGALVVIFVNLSQKSKQKKEVSN